MAVRVIAGEKDRFEIDSSRPGHSAYLLDLSEDGGLSRCSCVDYEMRIYPNRQNRQGVCFCKHMQAWAIWHVSKYHRLDARPIPAMLKNAAANNDPEFVLRIAWNLIDLKGMRAALKADEKKEKAAEKKGGKKK